MSVTRLSLCISRSGYCSRRKADQLIERGQVEVNGKPVVEPFYRVQENDSVKVEGKLLKNQDKVYLVFNKPEGVTVTKQDSHAPRIVMDYMPKGMQNVYPIGRLDKDSSGLLLLTNDGDLCYQVTHPKFELEKEYILKLAGLFTPSDIARAQKGLFDEGERLNIKQAKIIHSNSKFSVISVVITEGKKRHLRRLFWRLGFEVKGLLRVRIGALLLGKIEEGQYKLITKEKIYQLLGIKEK